MANHLQGSTSPYLLQHVDNLVNWYPWGESALQQANVENKPIFLSIGYSACHWCHVMAHESFEDQQIATILNQHFVSIKVDREERPDLDRIYMSAVQALTGNGGWPMSVFIFPDGRPFYGGTYFPPEPRYGMPSFRDVLLGIADAWQNRRDDLEHNGQQLLDMLQQRAASEQQAATQRPSQRAMDEAWQRLQADYDKTYGGWGAAPKFPQPMLIEFLLRQVVQQGNQQALAMATQALDAMALGGIYDQLGGGFHRYAVDANWLTPHFEKMLYDNAQLARVYLHAWQITGKPLYQAVVQETLDWALAELHDPAGGFYAAWDADSEGHEGVFYVWSQAEIDQVLGSGAPAFADAYGVTSTGNFEGQNILWLRQPEQRNALASERARLLKRRGERIRPHLDDKVILSWNGLMLATLAEAGTALGRADYAAKAQETAAFMLSAMRQSDGSLLRSWRAGHAHLAAYLEDYTHLIDGLLALYQANQETRWFVAAMELAQHMVEHFAVGASGPGFYDTSDQHEALIVRPREMQDNATPSGNAMAVSVLLRLASLQQDAALERLAVDSLSSMQATAGQHPLAFGRWLLDLQEALASTEQIIIVGDKHDARTQELLHQARQGFAPQRAVAWRDPDIREHGPAVAQDHGLYEGQPAAYVCDHVQCYPPVTWPPDLDVLLTSLAPSLSLPT